MRPEFRRAVGLVIDRFAEWADAWLAPSYFRARRYWASRGRRSRWVWNGGLAIAGLVLVLPVVLMLVYRVVPPVITPLMVLRVVEGHGVERRWVPLDEVSPLLQRAVIAAEDTRFCQHGGIDWEAVDRAIEENRRGGRLLGASTISMQTSKNLFLLPYRTFLRKGAEVYLTYWLEFLWPKDRIFVVYLNIVEWGPGIYGAQAAAQHYFGVPAKDLSRRQAALMAAALPNPLEWRPDRPGAWMAQRAASLEARMRSVALGKASVCP